jgi:hypothetical protein
MRGTPPTRRRDRLVVRCDASRDRPSRSRCIMRKCCDWPSWSARWPLQPIVALGCRQRPARARRSLVCSWRDVPASTAHCRRRSAGHDASRWTRSSAGRAGRGPALAHLCDTRALGGGGRRRAGPAGSREAPVSSREDRRAEHQGKRAESGILSDIQHAALAYRFVRNVLAFSWDKLAKSCGCSFAARGGAAGLRDIVRSTQFRPCTQGPGHPAKKDCRLGGPRSAR